MKRYLLDDQILATARSEPKPAMTIQLNPTPPKITDGNKNPQPSVLIPTAKTPAVKKENKLPTITRINRCER